MEEKEEKKSIDTEKIKKETVETAKKVKESIKAANIKEETRTTKKFIVDMFKNPLEKIKEVSEDNTNKFLKTAIILLIIWTILVFINSTYSTIYYFGFSRVFKNILTVLKNILAPAIGILVYSIIVLVLNKKNKKSLTTVLSTITITQLPLIIASLVSILKIFSSNASIIILPFADLCTTLSIILGYFGLKNLFGVEGSKDFIKKYVLIQILYYVAYVAIALLGIEIY